MSDYISREAAINAAWHNFYPSIDHYCQSVKCATKKELEAIPAADVREVKKASWYGEADGYADGELVYDMWSCPICGKYFDEWDEKPDWNFCPNCGAEMREETDVS